MTAVRAVVGNDVVDLTHPRCAGKASDERFLRRVLAESERMLVRGASSPGDTLWLLWAAKEAAFKVVTKLRGTAPPFEHAAFVVEIAGGREEGTHGREEGTAGREEGTVVREEGIVTWEGIRVVWRACRLPGGLHVVAWPEEAGRDEGWRAPFGLEAGWLLLDEAVPLTLESALGRLTADERRAVHHLASARVRLEARAHLSRALDVAEERLQIVCPPGPYGRTPPAVLLDGRACEADVSLSHHGRFVAWALLGKGTQGG